MKTNKIILVLVSCVVLLTVFCVNCFAFFPGISYGNSLYSDATFIKASSLYFTQLDGDQDLMNGTLTIPLDDTRSYYETTVGVGDQGGDFFKFIAPDASAGSKLYQCDIYWAPTLTADEVNGTFDEMGLLYEDSSISFNSKSALADYLLTYDACPVYFTGVPSSLSGLKMSGTVSVYNGNTVLTSEEFSYTSKVLSSSYTRLVHPFMSQIYEWVKNLDILNGWHTLTIENLKISTTADTIDLNELDFIRLGVNLPTATALPDGLTFRSVAETTTIVSYDLNPLQFLFDTFSSFFSTEIFMGVTLGHLFIVAIAVPALAAVLKAFGGK